MVHHCHPRQRQVKTSVQTSTPILPCLSQSKGSKGIRQTAFLSAICLRSPYLRLSFTKQREANFLSIPHLSQFNLSHPEQ